MTKITESLSLIPGRDEMIPDSHVYLIGQPDSGDLSLVDAGLMGHGAYKLKEIAAGGVKPADIKRIIMTHTHLDHIGCLRELIDAIPSLEVWVHESEAGQLEAGDDRTVYGMEMFKQMCRMQYSLKEGDFKFKVDRRLKEGDELNIGGETWTVLHIPGHSAGGIGLWNAAGGVLIPGDVVYADNSIGRFDLYGADAGTLAASLTRLGGLDVKVLLPGHNRIVTNVPKGYIAAVAKQWAPYLG
jgi:glyoxylase-like metal-dependent hydrolase (beta-lactamase superfamily II)